MLREIKQELKQGKTLITFTFLQATGEALGMVAPLVVAKFFSEDLFGRYSLAKMVVFFFTSVLIASAQAPFIVYATQERDKTGKINMSFSIQCVFFAFSIITFLSLNLIFNKALATFVGVSPADLTFVSLAFIGIALKTFFSNLFMALGQRVKSSLTEVVFGSLALVIVLVLCLTSNVSLRTVLSVYFVSGFLVAILFVTTIDFKLLLPFDFSWGHFKYMFDFTKWVMLGSTAAYFVNWGDNIVLRSFVSMGDIGEYNLGYQIFKGITMLAFVMNAYFLPFISERPEDSTRMRDYLFNKRPKVFLVCLIGVALVFLLAPTILRLFYGTTYQKSATVLRVLLVGSVALFYTIFYYPVLNALKKYKFTQTISLLQAVLNLVLDLVLVPVMGLLGAAVATVFAYFCWAGVIEVYFRVKLRKLLKL
jgi:O-antigen/teichoic acid export membrane protein